MKQHQATHTHTYTHKAMYVLQGFSLQNIMGLKVYVQRLGVGGIGLWVGDCKQQKISVLAKHAEKKRKLF